MKRKYYVSKNAQSNGDHEVHHEGCSKPSLPENRLPLGEFTSCRDAVATAKKIFSTADGCKICSLECHTR